MRFVLALLTCALSLPATAATTTTKTKKKSTAKIVKDDFGTPTAARLPAASRGVSQVKVGNPNLGGADVRIVPVLGVTVNSMSGLEDWIKDQKIQNYSTTPDTGFSVGALVDFGVGLPTTVFETGLAYTQVAQKFAIGKDDYAFVMNYLSLPLQGKTYLQHPRSGLYVHYGLLGNFLLGATFKSPRESTDYKDKMTSLNMMASAGVGYTLPVNAKMEGLVNFSASRSLNKVNSEGDASLYNNTFLLNVGLAL